jgi:hypothetical protein
MQITTLTKSANCFLALLFVVFAKSSLGSTKPEDPWSRENLAKGAIVEFVKQMTLCGDSSRFSCPEFNPGPGMGILLRDVLAAKQNTVARRNLIDLGSYYLGEELSTDYTCLVARQGKAVIALVDEAAKHDKSDCERYAESFADPRSTQRILEKMCLSSGEVKVRLNEIKNSIVSGKRC